MAAWIRDEPELAGIGGVERVLLVGAAMHRDLQWASRDLRRVEVLAAHDDRLCLAAPARNAWVIDDAGLASPWERPQWFTARAIDLALLRGHVEGLAATTAPLCDSASGLGAFSDVVFELLARDLGPPSGWRAWGSVEGASLASSYCCGYDATVVARGDVGVLLLAGMYC